MGLITPICAYTSINNLPAFYIRCSDCFQFSAIIKNVVLNILIVAFVHTFDYFLEKIPEQNY